jgi:hypothetical protein
MSVSIVRPLRAAISLTPRDGNVNNAVRLLSLNRLSTARAAKIRLERILALRTLVLHLERVGTITVPVEDGLGDEISYNRLVENLCWESVKGIEGTAIHIVHIEILNTRQIACFPILNPKISRSCTATFSWRLRTTRGSRQCSPLSRHEAEAYHVTWTGRRRSVTSPRITPDKRQCCKDEHELRESHQRDK